MICTHNRVRLKADTSRPYVGFVDELIGGVPILSRGRALRVELGLFCNKAILSDTAHLLNIQVEFKPRNNRTEDALASASIDGPFDVITADEWDDGEVWNTALEFAEAAMEFNMGVGVFEIPLWMVVTATTTQGVVTLAAGNARMIEDGG